MANNLSDVVEVFIDKQTSAIDTASFDIPCVMAAFTNFPERARVYTSMAGIAEDFNSSDVVYKMVQTLFGQELKPASVVVGRRQVDSVTIVPTVANNATYIVTVNEVAYSYTSDANATADEIATGLDIAIGTVAGINVVDNTGSITIAPATSGSDWSVRVSSNLVKQDAASTETWTDTIDAVEDVNDQWFALTTETRVKADILEIAAAIQARRKIYGAATADADVPTTQITDVATALSDLNYDQTFLVYSKNAATQYPECAWVGSQLPEVPGSNDWNLKTATGVTIDRLTETQKTNLRNKNCNFYTRKAGVEVFQDGNMVSGAPIDESVFILWLITRLEESVFFRMVNVKKIPFTRTGATIIENDIRTVLSQGVANGGIAEDTPYTVVAPDPLAIPEVQRAQRLMGEFLIAFRLAGSVRKVIIRGVARV